MSAFDHVGPQPPVSADGLLQVGSDSNLMVLAGHLAAGGTYETSPTFVLACPGDTARTLDLGSKTHSYAKWTEYLYVASGKLDTLADTGAKFELRFYDKADFEGSAGSDARAMMEDADTDIFSGDQDPSWSSASAAPPATTLGVAAYRVQVDLDVAETAVDHVTWFHTTAARVWDGGIPTSSEVFTRGAGTGTGWYEAGGSFTAVVRGDIES